MRRKKDRRETTLALRLTQEESDRVKEVAQRFPFAPVSAIARVALMKGLAIIEKEGIRLDPR
jgi:hypothetical protein